MTDRMIPGPGGEMAGVYTGDNRELMRGDFIILGGKHGNTKLQ